MFDAQLRPLIDRLLNPIGRGLVTLGVTANQVTMIGAAFGLIAAGCVAAGRSRHVCRAGGQRIHHRAAFGRVLARRRLGHGRL